MNTVFIVYKMFDNSSKKELFNTNNKAEAFTRRREYEMGLIHKKINNCKIVVFANGEQIIF